MKQVLQSSKLAGIRYELRGRVPRAAKELEALGHRILNMNLGDPAPFAFPVPEPIVHDIIHNLGRAQGYSDSKGLFSARTAIAQHYQSSGLLDVQVEDVFIGNGVSELIPMALQALLEDGDEVLVPTPDFPVWTAAVGLADGIARHYLCDPDDNWLPSLEDIERKITPRTRAIVIINPNNPTGAVYPEETLKGIADLARKHDLVIFADEIYEKVLFEGRHFHVAAVAPDLCCITFSGLSKAYRMPGYRAGWLVITGPRSASSSYREGLELLASLRLCANVPAQHAIQTALGGYQSIDDLVGPKGRLRLQRDLAHQLLNGIPGLECVRASGALYLFVRIDPQMYSFASDEDFAYELLQDQKLLVTHGSAFNWFGTHYFRFAILPSLTEIEDAAHRLRSFLESRANTRNGQQAKKPAYTAID
ncbi:putative alanine aminotransferase [Arthrobacter globiformis NBRC 12137]|uniref:alanine transaminase n=1 Tax=Arthrobacter globiformis (strain ATCC 8010 / DSM 20124 / JCM 1332 / NBRC 12137 / NCIMB 8907 / NRRL B-2979 / 168) TaxID=1077972 RepID=H0QK36_ARTG1|nr:pyridoxal phosphate-dependent aminotransferase [Arthrobacter globiformis]GAB13276.1 putative alanine aminotransferase [Arthrobacter globiformis NBRC 12137]